MFELSNYTTIDKIYYNNNTINVGNGKMIVGLGPVGNDKRGPIVEFNSDGFIFNSDEDQYNGTGGGVCNLKIFKKLGIPGNTAIKLTATGPDRRCGETLLERLLIYGSGNSQGIRGTWENGIVIDGSMLTTSGSAGIRATTINNVRISDCTGYGVLMNNAVHCKINGLQLDPGGNPDIKMLIKSGQNILGNGLIINGPLTIDGSKIVVLSGYVDTLNLINVDSCIFTGIVNNLNVSGIGSNGKFVGLVKKQLTNTSPNFKVI